MITFPNAKINIGLRITGKRPDGYHDIQTVFYPVELSDALEFVVSDQTVNKDILKVTGIDTGTKPDENLVISCRQTTEPALCSDKKIQVNYGYDCE